MGLVLAIAAVGVVLWLTRFAAIHLVHLLAILLAAFFYWQRELLLQALLSDPSPRKHRRLVARHLKLSLRMTELYSLLPRSSERGYEMARAKVKRNAQRVRAATDRAIQR